MNDKYILVDKEVLSCEDTLEWSLWFEGADRHIGRDDVNGILISTVFLGIDHGFMSDIPVVFETMVFGGVHDQEMWRYSTFDEAETGHAEVVEMIQQEFSN